LWPFCPVQQSLHLLLTMSDIALIVYLSDRWVTAGPTSYEQLALRTCLSHKQQPCRLRILERPVNGIPTTTHYYRSYAVPESALSQWCSPQRLTGIPQPLLPGQSGDTIQETTRGQLWCFAATSSRCPAWIAISDTRSNTISRL
jgi:hypothetical protein